MRGISFSVAVLLAALIAPSALQGQATPIVTVSSASYKPTVAPGSIATVFGVNLATRVEAAKLDDAGKLPVTLAGTSVTVDGKPAELIYVSPTQVNFVLPISLVSGDLDILVKSPALATDLKAKVSVAKIAPGIFSIPCLRIDRGAVLNAVTYGLEPFQTSTAANGGRDLRTRLSIFGTGIRFAGTSAKTNVAEFVKVEATDIRGVKTSLVVEYAGAAPNFFGLDQINVILPAELENIGLLKLKLLVDGVESNVVTMAVTPRQQGAALSDGGYRISTVAGAGTTGVTQEGQRALEFRLNTPNAIAFGKDGSMYIANAGDHTVMRVAPDGLIYRFAGNGTEGSTGDEALAKDATLRTPVGLAIDRTGIVYIVDSADHRVRMVMTDGRIRAFAGTGVSGFTGDGGQAVAARIANPTAIVVDRYGTAYISDTNNNRIRRVTGDGRITALAGTGDAGFSGDGNSAYRAKLNKPGSLTLNLDGSLLVADNGNLRIRSIAQDSTIRTLVGTGTTGSVSTTCGPLDATFTSPLSLAVDATGVLWIADAGASRVMRMDSTCQVIPTAGNGLRGFSGDLGLAIQAQLDTPVGVAADALGNIYVAVAGSHRVRKLLAGGECPAGATLSFNPSNPAPGQTVTATIQLGCPALADTEYIFQSNLPIVGVIPPVKILAGQSSATFTFTLAGGGDGDIVVLTGASPNGSVDGSFRVTTPSADVLTVRFERSAVAGGESALGLVELGGAPRSTHTVVALVSNQPGFVVPATVTIPPGETSVSFQVLTAPVELDLVVVVSATSGPLTAQGTLTVNGGPVGPVTATLGSFSITPSTVTPGGTATGQIALTSPAPAGGVIVILSGGGTTATMPATITIPAGQTSGSFIITVSPTAVSSVMTITAASANTLTAPLTIGSASPTTGQISGLSITPTTVTAGNSATGTVTLSAPAGGSGVLVTLSSNNPAVTVPSSVSVQAGQTSVNFTVLTTSVNSTVNATITAQSENSAGAGLTVQPIGGGTGTISSIQVSPTTVVGGAGSTGSVVLGTPAGLGGVAVSLSSGNAAATVPASIMIPEGSSIGTFNITTTAVASTTPVAITATSANSMTATLTLNAPSAGPGTIGSLSLSPTTVSGGIGSTGTVTLSSPAAAGGVLVNLSSGNAAATVPASITISAGSSSVTFSISTTTVASTTPVSITASSANSVSATLTLNAATSGPGTIGSLSLSPTTVTGGSGSTGTVTLSSPAAAGGILVTLSSGNVAATVPGSITIASGSSSGTFSINTTAVASTTPVSITATSANSVSATLTLNASSAGPGTIGSVSLSPATVTGGSGSTGTVTLSSPAGIGGVLVTLSSGNAASTVPASITIPEGSSSGTFGVTTTAVVSTTPVSITATSANSVSATLTLNAPAAGPGTISSLSLSPATVTGGSGSTGTVTLSAPAATGGVLVNLSSGNVAATVPASITIAAGSSSGTFSVTTTSVVSTTPVSITATSANSVTATLTVNPSSAGPGTIGSVSLSPATVTGGSGSTGTVTLSSPAQAGGVLVTLSSGNVAATVPGSITIPEGSSSGTFSVTTTIVVSTTPVSITATSANSVIATLTLNAPAAGPGTIGSLSLSPTTVPGGSGSTGTVTLSSPAAAGGVLVNLSSGNVAATVPASITIAAGSSSGTFSISTSAVASTTPASITATSANSMSATLTINAPTAGPGTISSLALVPSTVIGGSGSTGTVTLTAPAAAGGVLVNLASGDPAATLPGSITIPAGQTSGTFALTTTTVPSTVSANITASSANSVTGTLTINALGAGQGTIGSLSLSPTTVTGGSGSTGTVTLSSPAGAGGVLVTLSSGNIAATVPGSITIASGSSSGTFSISTTSVASTTPVSISATSANSVSATLTINAPAPGQGTVGSLSLSPTAVIGGSGSTGTVTLSAPASAGGVLVNLSSGDPAATVPGSITIPAGSSSGSFAVTTTTVASTTAASITASSANSVSATLTINAPSAGQGAIGSLSLSPTSVTGGSGSTGTVTLSSPAAAGGVLVTLSSGNIAATVPGSITIASGSSSGTFSISTTSVASTTPVSIGASSANSVSATLTINPPAPGPGAIGSLSLSPTSVTGGSGSTGTVTLSSPAAAGGVLVNLSSGNAAATVPGSITIAAGSSSGTFSISTTTVASTTPVSIGANSANSVSATLAINPPAPGPGAIGSLSLSPASVTGGSGSTGTVTLSSPAAAGGVLVNLSSGNAAATVPGSITIAAGSSSGTFSISTTSVASTTPVSIGASSANSVSATLTINPPGPTTAAISSVSVSPNSVTGGSSSTGTVNLSAPAPAGGVLVTLASNNGAATVGGSITIPAGSSSGTFGISTTAVSSNVSASITATSANSSSASLAINSPCVQGLNLSVGSILGSGGLTGTVTLTGPAPAGGSTVGLAYVGAGVTGPGSVFIPQGSTTGTFSILTAPVGTILGAVIQALLGPCGGVSANLSVTAPVLNGLSINPSTLNLLGSGTGTVTLSGPAPAGGMVVNLTSSIAANLLGLPSSVTVGAGATTANFTASNLVTLLMALINPVTGTVTAALDGVQVSTGLTLRVLP